MFEQLACRCETCDRRLNDEKRVLTFSRDDDVRHAYECSSRAVTITVARE